jgi:hypothetical protein
LGDRALDKGVERQFVAALVSAIQISCNARLALGCWLFGNLTSTFAVLCTQQRCSRVLGQTSPAAYDVAITKRNPDRII